MMPVMDGRTVLEHLGQSGVSPPGVVVLAVADPRIRSAMSDSGASAWLLKPVDVKELLIECARVLSTRNRS